jgi:hypothetical protein
MADKDEEMLEPSNPGVILLLLGVVDIKGNKITQTKLIVHKLANCTENRHNVEYYYIW